MIIQEYVDHQILIKRLKVLENTLDYIDMDELLDESFDINTSLYLYETTTNRQVIKIVMENMKAAKVEIKIAKQCKKDNNIKEAVKHLDKADKLLLETDRKIKDIDDFSEFSNFLASISYTLLVMLRTLLFLVPGLVINFVGGKKLENDIKDTNKNISNNITKVLNGGNAVDLIRQGRNQINDLQNKANNINKAIDIATWSGIIAAIGRSISDLVHTRKIIQNNGAQKSINVIVMTLRNSIDNTRKIISKIKSNL